MAGGTIKNLPDVTKGKLYLGMWEMTTQKTMDLLIYQFRHHERLGNRKGL